MVHIQVLHLDSTWLGKQTLHRIYHDLNIKLRFRCIGHHTLKAKAQIYNQLNSTFYRVKRAIANIRSDVNLPMSIENMPTILDHKVYSSLKVNRPSFNALRQRENFLELTSLQLGWMSPKLPPLMEDIERFLKVLKVSTKSIRYSTLTLIILGGG